MTRVKVEKIDLRIGDKVEAIVVAVGNLDDA